MQRYYLVIGDVAVKVDAKFLFRQIKGACLYGLKNSSSSTLDVLLDCIRA